MNFTESQNRVINITKNNSQIIACAGSGKTTTMVAKILNLIIKEALGPQNIVAITYTEKAASALKQKIYKEYENRFGHVEGLADMYIGTIHGYCLYMLQEFTDDFKNYEILNEVQTKLFMKKMRKENGLMDVVYHPKIGNPYNLIHEYSNNLKIQEAIKAYKMFLDISRELGIEEIKNKNLVAHIDKYERTLSEYKYFDFTSILVATQELINSGTLNKYVSDNIKHMIIDEYQDINDAQENIIRFFYNNGTKICVVGDDDQTIYHWRGSNLKYIKEFGIRYEDVIKEDLDINFRSSIGITESAKQVINHNDNRIFKEMKSNQIQKYEQGDIVAKEYSTRAEEVQFIVSKIKQLKGTKYISRNGEFGLDLDDMVILVSSVKKIPDLIEELEKNDIKFIVEGTQKLFESEEIIVLCQTFELLFDIPDKNARYQIAGNKSDCKIEKSLILNWKKFTNCEDDQIRESLVKFVDFYINADEFDYTIQENLKKLFIDLNVFESCIDEKVLYNWGKFTQMVNDYEKINLLLKPYYKINGFRTFLRDDAPLIYPEGWLSPNFRTIRCLRIMTYHQAKGLEFPVVFLPFLTENACFPLKKPGGTSGWGILNDESIKNQFENDTESHRRLFYVGITRSEKYLFMTRSNVPFGNGKMFKKPAQVFKEVKHSLYVQQSDFLTKSYEKSSLKKFSSDEVISLNFSLLKDLFECPFKFKMLNVFGFTQPLDIRMGYGKSIHSMLDFVHKNYMIIDFEKKENVEDTVKKFLHLPYASPILKTEMEKKAKKHLESYIKNNKSKFKFILFSEKTIDYTINEYLFINGRIDLIRDDINKTTTIVDFKSNSEVLSEDQIKNQMMIYVLGYESLTGENVDYIESYDFSNTDPKVLPIRSQDKELFKVKLKQCQDIIKSGNYMKIVDLDSRLNKKYCSEIDCAFCKSCFK